MNIKSLVIDDIDYDWCADCYYLKNEDKIVGGVYCGDNGFIVKTDDNEVKEHFKAIVQESGICYGCEEPDEIVTKLRYGLNVVAEKF